MAEGFLETEDPLVNWLHSNDIYDLDFISHQQNITLDDLLSMKETHLEEFMAELKLKALTKHKLSKALTAQRKSKSTPASPDDIQSPQSPKLQEKSEDFMAIIVSKEEHRIMSHVRKKKQDITRHISDFRDAHKALKACKNEQSLNIDGTFKDLRAHLDNLQAILHMALEDAWERKQKLINVQIEDLEKYGKNLDDLNDRIKGMVRDESMDIEKRSEKIDAMYEEVKQANKECDINIDDIYCVPKIEYTGMNEVVLHEYLTQHCGHIDSFYAPVTPHLAIKEIDTHSITIDIAVNPLDPFPERVTEYEIELWELEDHTPDIENVSPDSSPVAYHDQKAIEGLKASYSPPPQLPRNPSLKIIPPTTRYTFTIDDCKEPPTIDGLKAESYYYIRARTIASQPPNPQNPKEKPKTVKSSYNAKNRILFQTAPSVVTLAWDLRMVAQQPHLVLSATKPEEIAALGATASPRTAAPQDKKFAEVGEAARLSAIERTTRPRPARHNKVSTQNGTVINTKDGILSIVCLSYKIMASLHNEFSFQIHVSKLNDYCVIGFFMCEENPPHSVCIEAKTYEVGMYMAGGSRIGIKAGSGIITISSGKHTAYFGVKRIAKEVNLPPHMTPKNGEDIDVVCCYNMKRHTLSVIFNEYPLGVLFRHLPPVLLPAIGFSNVQKFSVWRI